jgi:hypothetical protein
MSHALPLGGRTRHADRPRWARLDGLSQLAVLSAVTILFCVSGGMLWIIGYNYDGLAGSAATKIHPSTYLICLIFAWSVLGCGDPVSRTIHLANRRPGTLLMLLVAVAVLLVTILRDGPGLGGIVDTYIAACLLVLLLADADEATMARLEQLVHLAMAANALMALAEFLLQVRFFPYRFDGIAFETDTRSAALHGHPLSNAMVTACYLMALLNGRRVQPAFLRTALIGLQFAALVVFGGRTALLISLFFGGVYGVAALLRSLQSGRISLLGAAAGCIMAAFIPAAIALLVAAGFFDYLVARFISDGGSANARAEMFTLLGMFSFRELILGPDLELLDSLRRVNGLEWGIENPFIRMTLYQGLIVTALVTVAFGVFMYELARVTRGGLWLPMIVWLVLLNGSESIATKTTLPAQFAVIALCLYRPDRNPGPAGELRAAGRGRASG